MNAVVAEGNNSKLDYVLDSLVFTLLGDVSLDGTVDFLTFSPLSMYSLGDAYLTEADIDQNGVVDFFDIQPFIDILLAP